MSNELTMPDMSQVPAHLADLVGGEDATALADAISAGLAGDGDIPRISIKAGRFRLVQGGVETLVETTHLDVVIIDANPRISKQWYAKPWDSSSETFEAPDCFSLDGVKPHPSSTDTQNDVCETCLKNAWGSAVSPTGNPTKACSDSKRLAVVSAADPDGGVYLLRVPPASFKPLNSYMKELAMRKIPVRAVKTRVGFDADASFPKLTFSFVGFIASEHLPVIEGLKDHESVKFVTGESSKPVMLPAPTATAAAETPPAPAAPVVETPPAPAAPVVETPAPAAPAAPAAPGGGLADEVAKLMAMPVDTPVENG